MAEDEQYTDAQLSDGTTLRFKGTLTPPQVKMKVAAYRNSQPTQFEKENTPQTTLTSSGVDEGAQNPVSRTLSAAGGALMAAPGALLHAAAHPYTTLKGIGDSIGNAADFYADPKTRPSWEDIKSVLPEAIGGGIGNVAAGEAMGAVAGPAIGLAKSTIGDISGAGVKNTLAEALRNPATSRQSLVGKPGTVKDILPSQLQRYTLPPWVIPKGDLGTPTNPGPFMDIPAKMPKQTPAPFTPLTESPYYNQQRTSLADDLSARKAVPVTQSPYYTQNQARLAAQQAEEDAAAQAEAEARKPVPLNQSPNLNINKERSLTGQSVPLSESPNLLTNKQNALTGQSVSLADSPNRTLNKPAPLDPFAGMTPSNQPIGNAALPELRGNPSPFAPPVQLVNKFSPTNQKSVIESPYSPPPPMKVTYQSATQADLLRLVKSGDRAAIREWQRRSLPLPEGVGFMVEKGASTLPWRNPDN